MIRTLPYAGLAVVSVSLMGGCGRPSQSGSTAAPAAAAPAPAAPARWPASLKVMGEGFPNPGDPCRRLGETDATSNYLDDSATLAGCLSAEDAARLGGTVVGTVDGVTLVSVR